MNPHEVRDAVERRIRRLHFLIAEEDDGTVADARSRAALGRFLDALGSYVRPSVFIMEDGTYRAVWSTPTGHKPAEQFAVRFMPTGRVQVVYSDPVAGQKRTRSLFAAGGLVAVEIAGSGLIELLRSTGLERFVREGVLPARD